MMRRVLVVITFIAVATVTAWGASPQDVARLGKDLNYAGAEKAGNKEGTIPAWDGKDVPLAGCRTGSTAAITGSTRMKSRSSPSMPPTSTSTRTS